MKKNLNKKTVGLASSLILFFALLISLSLSTGVPKTADEAFSKFYSDVAEDQLMDPLILAGKKVLPLLLEKISDKNMPKRRYAIGAIGNIGDASAIPILIDILDDPGEEDYFRCDAFLAIAMISREYGYKLAQQYEDNTNECLARLSNALLSNDPDLWKKANYMKRSYWQALLGRHS